MRKLATSRWLAVSVLTTLAALSFALSSSAQLQAAPGAAQAGNPETPAPASAVAQSGGRPLPPVQAHAFRGDVRDLPPVAALPLLDEINEERVSPSRPAPEGQWQAEPAVAANMPAPSASFAGLALDGTCTGGKCGAGWPPDTVGDVGPNHYIEAVNTSIAIFSKTGTRLAAFAINSLWATANSGTACDSANRGDPTVLYDPLAGRWIIADFAFTNVSTTPYYECLAVSMSGDPVSGGWYLLPLRADDAGHLYLNDYPKTGLWPDGLYLTANEFDEVNNAGFKGVRIWAINRARLEAGVLQAQVFDIPINDAARTGTYSLLPANLRGVPPPAGSPEYLASESLWSYAFEIYKLTVDWNSPANSLLSGPTIVSQANHDQPEDKATKSTNMVPQSGTNTKLDSLGDRLMMQLQYRNIGGSESLWLAHTVRPPQSTSSTPTAIQWAQLNVTGGTIAANPVQQQIFTNGGDGLYRWVPSIAADRMGNVAIGYSASSGTSFPSVGVAGRLATDPLSTLGQGASTLFAGTGSENFTCGKAACSRWGDYTAMTVDPTDDCTFWYVNEYYPTTGNNAWHTRIVSFKYPSCPPPPAAVTDLRIARDGSNAKLTWTNPAVDDSTRVLSSTSDPYFAPSAGTERGVYPVPTATWSDTAVLASATAGTTYYTVLGRVAGAEAVASNRVGVFGYGLVH